MRTDPRCRISFGEEAKDQFRLHLTRAFDDDATGGVTGYKPSPAGPVATAIHADDADLGLATLRDAHTLIVIDSGNSSGDSWKFIFETQVNVGIFLLETPTA